MAHIAKIRIAAAVLIWMTGMHLLALDDRQFPHLESVARMNFGCVEAAQHLTRSVTLRNTGDATLTIDSLNVSCPCVEVQAAANSIEAGGSIDIVISLDTTGLSGNLRRLVYVRTNDPDQPLAHIVVNAIVQTPGRADDDTGLRPHVPGEVLVRFDPARCEIPAQDDGDALATIAAAKGCTGMEVVRYSSNLACLALAEDESVTAACARLSADPDVVYVQPNYQYQPRIIPDDTHLDLQYHLHNTGQSIQSQSGIAGADIQAADAWDINTGHGIIVAVLDTGVDYTHPDLSSQMWDGTNCVDVNGDPLGDCIHGYDFSSGDDKDPKPSGSSHGTHIAGIVGALGNNGIGTAGAIWDVQIMAVRSSALTSSELMQGVYFASHNGAKVINASWGWAGSSCDAALVLDEALYDAIAQFPGLFVGAAGNSNRNHNGTTWYDSTDYGHPTNCWVALDNVLNVAMTNNRDQLSGNTDFGINVDIAAPGKSIYSTTVGTSYGIKTGTSMSAPLVVGVAALAWDFRPDLTVSQLREAIRSNGDCLDALSGKLFTSNPPYCSSSGARLNAYKILASLASPTISDLAGYTGPDRNTAIVNDGATIDVQPYWEWTEPVGQGILDGYVVELPGVFSGDVFEPEFDAAALNLTLLPGEHTITIRGRNDQGPLGAPISHSFVVTADEPLALFENLPATIDEGEQLTVQVRLHGAPDSSISISYQTTAGTATVDEDYLETNGTLTWAAGETGIRSFTIEGISDDLDEALETLTVTLSTTDDVTIVNATRTVFLVDDDDPPIAFAENITVLEDGVNAAIELSLLSPSGKTVTVDYATASSAALSTQDFNAVVGSLTWPPGSTITKTVIVGLINDGLGEPPEAFFLDLFNVVNATFPDKITVTILDDDAPSLAVSIADTSEDGNFMDVDVTMTGFSTLTVSATVSTTTNGTAQSGTDFEPLSTTVDWGPVETGTQTVQITLLDDLTDEYPETIHVELTAIDNAVIATGSDTAAIQDDDPPPFITVNDATANEGETISFTIELSAVSGKDVDFTYALTGESANVVGRDVAAGDDTAATISAGDTTTTITAELANDPRDEGDEIFNIILTVDPDTVATDQRSTLTATGTIVDDDVAFVLEAGWAMIGIPDGTDAPADTHSTILLYPRPTIWAWDAVAKRYDVFDETSDVTTAGSAYFAYASEAATLLFEIPAAPSSIELTAGWNLIAVTVQMDFAALSPAVIGVAWTWDGQTLVPVSQLEPRRAYWVYATEAAAIEF